MRSRWTHGSTHIGPSPTGAQLAEHADGIEQDVADDLSVLVRDQFEQDVAVLLKLGDDVRFVRPTEGAGVEIENCFAGPPAVASRIHPLAHESLRPWAMRAPR